ncbi:MAG TPA: DoxX family protein [Longimicrobiales bacterium]|nr:DoxX family protein [Longimicrobiales bacterium]
MRLARLLRTDAAPAIWATLVGGTEAVGGLMVTLGLLTRVAAVPLVVIMLVAIATTNNAKD